jgi:chaperone protein EcpD
LVDSNAEMMPAASDGFHRASEDFQRESDDKPARQIVPSDRASASRSIDLKGTIPTQSGDGSVRLPSPSESARDRHARRGERSAMNAIRQAGLLFLVAAYALLCPAVDARVVINGTRFIYPAAEKEISVPLLNRADHPILMKAWIDAGDTSTKAEDMKAPFLITPPLVRIEGNKGYGYRLTLVGDRSELPADRESLFWINFLEVPPKSTEQAEGQGKSRNSLQLAFQYRVKLLYRPEGLKGTPASTAEALTWRVEKNAIGGGSLIASNDGPYYVSLSRLALGEGNALSNLKPETIEPFSQRAFGLEENWPQSVSKVTYQWIDDWGGLHERTATLTD